MRFPPEFLEEIRARLPVSEVVGRRVRLKKSGREWNGLSPFNAEKSPSFFVNDVKMAWFDFSSGKNGNIFDFVMATEGLSFPEAVERLAGEAGLPLPQRTAETVAQEKRRAGLHEVLEKAAQFFLRRLVGREGARARDYLAQRGISADSQAAFRIGYAPNDRHALRDHLAGQDADLETMIEAGLLVHGDEVKVPYDRFRDRVMFPICDRSGRVIAFGGRALEKGVPAKYLNSPETTLFHKGALLYNHHQARKSAHDRGAVVAVEGYVDVVAMAAVGFPNVVAACGTALTPDQCDLLWKMAPEPTLCFDGDAAGRRAAFKAVETTLPLIGPSRSMRFAFLPDGQDPDDLARSGGASAITEVLEQAKPLVDVLWLRETEGHDFSTPEQRAGLERRLHEVVRPITDESLRRHYAAAMKERLAALLGPRRRDPSDGQRSNRGPAQRSGPTAGGRRSPFGPPLLRGYRESGLPPMSESISRSPAMMRAALPPREALIIASILNHPTLLERHFDQVEGLEFSNPEAARLRDAIVHLSGEELHDPGTLRQALARHGLEDVRARIEAAAERLPHWHLRADAAESDADHVLQQALTLHQKMQALHKQLKVAERALAQDGNDKTFAELQDIRERLSTLIGMEATVEGFGTSSGRAEPEV
ncbi:DNA primase [Lichenihabitans sp. Uapishka_5]|uniref:DNA primase n=1 Tax=Lichenihabitans sp. Uapishka_5 TaxID=3037302 RepID=UPI0029E7F458|nr:DNA primase [Lichenihabitans sp. Uapishka_5]MDX7949790.1 DNA primase [Lichenihabitans sp. Uapishka_5]